MFKANFPIKVLRSNAFSQKLFILNAKKLKDYCSSEKGNLYRPHLQQHLQHEQQQQRQQLPNVSSSPSIHMLILPSTFFPIFTN